MTWSAVYAADVSKVIKNSPIDGDFTNSAVKVVRFLYFRILERLVAALSSILELLHR